MSDKKFQPEEMGDTPAAIEKKMLELISAKTPAERLMMASEMFDTARILMSAGILRENKNLTEFEVREKMFLKLYGDCFSPEECEKIISKISENH